MRECFVSFASATQVQDFVNIATKQTFAIQVVLDQMTANAKSIMSLYSMGLRRRLKVLLPETVDAEDFLQAVKPYLAD